MQTIRSLQNFEIQLQCFESIKIRDTNFEFDIRYPYIIDFDFEFEFDNSVVSVIGDGARGCCYSLILLKI